MLKKAFTTAPVLMHWIPVTWWSWGLMAELLSPLAVMSEGLGFNLCIAPFLNVSVLNLSQRVGVSGSCQRWSELGWRCHARVGQEGTKVRS